MAKTTRKATAVVKNARLNGKTLNGFHKTKAGEPDLAALVGDHDFDAPEVEVIEPIDEEVDLEETPEELVHEDAVTDSTDDPVRMYLMQMGQIPLLNRAEEVASAKEIERTRTLYRHRMLATDYVLQAALEILTKVYQGELRLDRTIEVSVTNTTEKKRIMKRLGPNLITLKHLLVQNHKDYRFASNRRQPISERRAAWRRLVRRRNKAVRLIEELKLRTNRLQPLFALCYPGEQPSTHSNPG